MSKYQSQEKPDGVIKIEKSYQGLAEENKEISDELDHITKEELIEAIYKLADKVGVEVKFTYENKKNDLR